MITTRARRSPPWCRRGRRDNRGNAGAGRHHADHVTRERSPSRLGVHPRSFEDFTSASRHAVDRCPAHECKCISLQTFPILCQMGHRLTRAIVLSTNHRFGDTTSLPISDRVTIATLTSLQTHCNRSWNFGPRLPLLRHSHISCSDGGSRSPMISVAWRTRCRSWLELWVSLVTRAVLQ